jgi:hypothetical protein
MPRLITYDAYHIPKLVSRAHAADTNRTPYRTDQDHRAAQAVCIEFEFYDREWREYS